ncbi:MAG: hypothetical protein L3J51_06300 [Cocleimonas sp.]|nr:hypothetical protein [Cocleimonas sp.]
MNAKTKKTKAKISATNPRTCAGRVPILPTRYSVGPKKKGDNSKASYQGKGYDLESGYQESFNTVQNTLRLMPEGFVYLYDYTEDLFHVWKYDTETSKYTALMSNTASLEEGIKNYKTKESLYWIWAKEYSTVYIWYSDTLMTSKKLAEIQNNPAHRAKVTTELNVQQWMGAQKSKHGFPAKDFGELIEEYKDPKPDLGWSAQQTKALPLEEMQKYMKNNAPNANIGIALHANIARAVDMSALVIYQQRELAKEIAKTENTVLRQKTTPAHQSGHHAHQTHPKKPIAEAISRDLPRHHKKVIADLIGKFYYQGYAQDHALKDKDGKLQADEKTVIAHINKQRPSQADYEAAKNEVQYLQKKKQFSQKNYSKDVSDLHANQLNAVIYKQEEIIKNYEYSDEQWKNKVLGESKGNERLMDHIREPDRIAFLADYKGSLNDAINTLIATKNDRAELLKTYQQTSQPTDLGSSFECYDHKHKVSGTAHATAFASCIYSMLGGAGQGASKDKALKTDNEWALFHRWWQQDASTNPMLINLQLDKSLARTAQGKKDSEGDTLAGINTLVEEGYKISPLTFATEEIFQNLTIYSLHHSIKMQISQGMTFFKNLKLADTALQKLANMPSKANAIVFRKIIEEKLKDKVAIGEHPTTKMRSYLTQASNLGETSPTVKVHSDLPAGTRQAKSVYVLETQSNISRKANPFHGMGSLGMNSIVGFLNILNLVSAVSQMQGKTRLDKFTDGFNLVSAVAATGGALQGIAIAVKNIPNHPFEKVLTSDFARKALSAGIFKALGFASAIFDALTQFSKAISAVEEGNYEAATAYAGAGVALGLGGVALTVGGAALFAEGATLATSASFVIAMSIGAWLFLGVGLIIVGILFLFWADSANYTAIEKWLDSSTFGKHLLKGAQYFSPKEEMTRFNDIIQKLRYEADKMKGDDALYKEKKKQILNQIDPKDPFFGSGYTEA